MNAQEELQSTVTPVRTAVTVEASIERAFEAFTDGFDRWWPRSHHIGTKPMARAVLEAKKDGRLFELADDGTECDWGKVLVCEAPARIVFSWQINGAWKYEPEITRASEVEIRFVAIGVKRTRVELEHRHFERHGEAGAAIRKAVGSPEGWTGILEKLVATLRAA
jgi:uncharacterized protein YndB with AHSA1/START domain